jgi:hypothetical protein
MAELDNIASQLLKSASEADKIYSKTRDQSQKDKATRLRVIVQNLKTLTLGASDLNGLSDVTISAAANAQVLTYNSTTSQWENQTPAAGGGGDMLKSTYDVDNDGIVDGSETTQIIVRNSTGSTLTKGQVVYLSGATGNRPNAVLSQANTEATSSKTIGIVVANIANNADGFVAVNGTLHDLDTSAFADGDSVWLSAATAGAFTSTIPAEPNHTVFIGYIARAHPTQGRIVILIQNGYELNELHGVLVGSEANNDLLVYETSTTLWKNKSISTIFGGTPLVSVPTLAQVTTAGNTTTNAITVGGLTVNTNLIYTDTVNSRVGIGTTSPTRTLTVAGHILLSVNNQGLLGKLTSGSEVSMFNVDTSNNVAFGTLYNGAATLFYTGTLYDWYQYPSSVGTHRMRLASSGNLLINTTTDAGYKLDVNGTFRTNDRAYIGEDVTFTSAQYYYLISPSADGQVTFTNSTVTNGQAQGFFGGELSLAGTQPYINHRAINIVTTVRNTSTSNIAVAFYASGRTGNTGAANKVAGFLGGVIIEGSGNVTNAIGLEVEILSQTNNKTITNLYGVKVQPLINSVGTITNTYGVYIDSLTAGTQTNAAYGIYQAGTDRNYFGGNVGLGITAPLAKYHQYQVQGIMARYDISSANADQNRGVWDFYTNAASAPDFFGRFGFKFEGGVSDAFKQFQINIADQTTPKLVVTGGGLVGIGTIAPTYKVDVQGTTLATSTISAQGAFNIARVPAPTGTITLTPSAGGSVDVGQHYYFVTYTTAIGETERGSSPTITLVSGSQTVTITGIPVSTDPRVTGRKIYRTRAGQTSDRGMVIATIANNTTTSYVDTAADSTFPNLGDWGAYRDNTTSRQITIDGTKAMALGTGVTAIGFGAGASVTTAGLTTLVGYNAGNALTYGFQNTLVGTQAGRFVNTGSGNTALGSYCLMGVTTGNDNISVGQGSSFYNQTGSYNIAVGSGALSGQSGVSHSSNIAIGTSALSSLGAANNNVAIGHFSGRYISSGAVNTLTSNSILIGYDTRPNANNETNQIVIGYSVSGLGSNTTILGNSSTTFTSIPAGNMTVGGTTNAGYKLDVVGTINATAYSVGGIAGWSGNINIPTMPPIVITVTNGIITNVM